MAKVRCYICFKDWDSATEAEPAEWVEIARDTWNPVCPPCHRTHFPGQPRRAARSSYYGSPSPIIPIVPTLPVKREVPFLVEE